MGVRNIAGVRLYWEDCVRMGHSFVRAVQWTDPVSPFLIGKSEDISDDDNLVLATVFQFYSDCISYVMYEITNQASRIVVGGLFVLDSDVGSRVSFVGVNKLRLEFVEEQSK